MGRPIHPAGLIHLEGQIFGRLTVIGRSTVKSGDCFKWTCQCDCGKTKAVDGGNLRHGRTTSCGCIQKERAAASNMTHGAVRSPEYKSWQAMKTRCLNPRNRKFPDYGGRGITICQEWVNDFTIFLWDMGPRPAGHTLDRKDNDGPYSKTNCRWATSLMQRHNRRDSPKHF